MSRNLVALVSLLSLDLNPPCHFEFDRSFGDTGDHDDLQWTVSASRTPSSTLLASGGGVPCAGIAQLNINKTAAPLGSARSVGLHSGTQCAWLHPHPLHSRQYRGLGIRMQVRAWIVWDGDCDGVVGPCSALAAGGTSCGRRWGYPTPRRPEGTRSRRREGSTGEPKRALHLN